MSIEVMKQALEYIKDIYDHCSVEGIEADKEEALVQSLRQAIENYDKEQADFQDLVKQVQELERQACEIIRGAGEPVACKHKRYSNDVTEDIATCYDCGAEGRMRFVANDTSPLQAEKQEPYCWVQSKLNQGLFYKEKPRRIHTIPLYTAPPKREWQELTDEDWHSLPASEKQGCERDAEIFNWIEDRLKEKNT